MKNPSYVLYINMSKRHDYDTWLHLAKVCFEKSLLRTANNVVFEFDEYQIFIVFYEVFEFLN